MDLLPINVGKLSAIVNEKTRTVNTDSAVMVHFEVVYGPIATFGRTRWCCSCKFGQTSPSGLESFLFLRTPS